MNIPKYWARGTQDVAAPGGQRFALNLWGWSNRDEAEASARARERVEQIAAKLASGASLDRYGYGDRPLREEIVQEVRYSTGQPAAVITRNSYGALVLNTAAVMFADIDVPGAEDGRGAAGEARALAKLEEFTRRNPSWAMRAYRTRGGLRALVTHAVFDPMHASTEELLRAFGSDPLYIRLCRAQQCFRARLTPKPWRLDAGTPPAGFPFADARDAERFRGWLQDYEHAGRDHGVCKFLRAFGTAPAHAECAALTEVHDRMTRVAENLPLA